MIEWDDAKNIENRAKHGLDFADFQGFDGKPATFPDDRSDYGELRFRSFGRINGKGHMVAFTYRENSMRLFSFRRVHDKELKKYAI